MELKYKTCMCFMVFRQDKLAVCFHIHRWNNAFLCNIFVLFLTQPWFRSVHGGPPYICRLWSPICHQHSSFLPTPSLLCWWSTFPCCLEFILNRSGSASYRSGIGTNSFILSERYFYPLYLSSLQKACRNLFWHRILALQIMPVLMGESLVLQSPIVPGLGETWHSLDNIWQCL